MTLTSVCHRCSLTARVSETGASCHRRNWRLGSLMSEAGSDAGMVPDASMQDLDVGQLDRWLSKTCPGTRILTVEKFPGGQSNPTYELHTTGAPLVLRRKPFGALLASAHAIEREFRVLRALNAADYPTPQVVALCENPRVIGAAFYVMSKVEGRIFWDVRLPDEDRDARGAIYDAQIRALARLHQLGPEQLGLVDFGRPGNYFARQVSLWTRQYRLSETTPIEAMDRLAAWLAESVPAERAGRIVHGDFKLDNLVFHADRPEIAAVLDWELATIGDPLADLTYMLMPWVAPPGERNSLWGVDPAACGLPPPDQVLERYVGLGGPEPAAPLAWYFAFNLFRIAAIVQGVAARHVAGNASSPQAAEAGRRVGPLADAGWRQAEAAGA